MSQSASKIATSKKAISKNEHKAGSTQKASPASSTVASRVSDALILSVNRDAAVAPKYEPDTKSFRNVRQQVIRSHKSLCHYCQIAAGRAMHVHHVNGDHADNRRENLVPVCPLCMRVFHLEVVADRHEAADLIYLPELSQKRLNGLMYALFAAKQRGGEMGAAAMDIQVHLQERRMAACEILDLPLHDRPAQTMSDFLIEMPDKSYAHRHAFLKHVRLLITDPETLGATDLRHLNESVFSTVPFGHMDALGRRYLPKGQILNTNASSGARS